MTEEGKRRDENAAIGRSAGKIGAGTFLSHIFGMVRDIIFAFLFGKLLSEVVSHSGHHHHGLVEHKKHHNNPGHKQNRSNYGWNLVFIHSDP